MIVAESLWYTLSTVLSATNRHRRLAVIYLFGTALAVLLAVPLSSTIGLVGAAIALLAIDVLMIVYTVPAALGVIEEEPVDFGRSLLDVRGIIRWVGWTR